MTVHLAGVPCLDPLRGDTESADIEQVTCLQCRRVPVAWFPIGSDIELQTKDGHTLVHRVNALNEDGSPRIWGNGARHSPDCRCEEGP